MKRNEIVTATQVIANEKLKENGKKLTKLEVGTVIDALENAVAEAMEKGEKVKVVGATFSVKDVKERRGVTKLFEKDQEWVVPAHKEVTVKISKSMKKLLVK